MGEIHHLKIKWLQASARAHFDTLIWMASNFPVLDIMIISAFEDAWNWDRLPVAAWFYETYKDKFDWREVQRNFYAYSLPFYRSMIEDRAKQADRLAKIFNVTRNLESYEGRRLFRALFALNNVAAVEWLFEKYRPPLKDVFSSSDGGPSALVALMERYGRPELASLLSRRYGIVPAETIPKDLIENSVFALPPPRTKASMTSEEWRKKVDLQILR